MDEETIKKLMGKRIKSFRKKMNPTQFALGEMIDIDQRQVAYLEGGNSFPSLKTLNKFASVFNCAIKDFFEFESPESKKNLKTDIINRINKLDEKDLILYSKLLCAIEDYKF